MSEIYTFQGWAKGQFENDQGKKQAYANIYVTSPVSDYVSEDYEAAGYKAEKLKCVGPEVWADVEIGDSVQLFFDSKKRVAMMALA